MMLNFFKKFYISHRELDLSDFRLAGYENSSTVV